MVDTARPFTTFNFKVNLRLAGAGDGTELCSASFSDCDGMEMNMQLKTIREGGNNQRQIHLVGAVIYGQLSLKRGMTNSFDLWDWFERVQQEPNLRASGEIIILSSDRSKKDGDVQFVITGCLPVKLKAPTLSAKDGGIAIEEMQIAYETLKLKRPQNRGGSNA
jgi:phage tail-like protein